MRLFLCIELPSITRQHLSALSEIWKNTFPKASWVRPERLHVTLKFLGEVDASQVVNLCNALKVIPISSGYQLRPDHVECFPPRGAVRVIASGLAGDTDLLAELHAQIDDRCAALGIPAEGRPYHPHVTMARARPPLPAAAREVLAQAAEGRLPGPRFMTSGFTLMESRLQKTGPEYVPLTRFEHLTASRAYGPRQK